MSVGQGDRDSVGLALGSRIRAHRQLRRLSLRELAARAGTSASFLSQLERGQTGASVSSLVQIADALGVSLGVFFDGEPGMTPTVLRRADRPTLSTENGLHKTLLTARPADSVEVYGGALEPGGSTGPSYRHGDSQEVLVVLSGRVELTLDTVRLQLGEGDSVEYRSSVPHGLSNIGDGQAEVLWIVSPPTSRIPPGGQSPRIHG